MKKFFEDDQLLIAEDSDGIRYARSKDGSYNYNYDTKTGQFSRWGKTLEEDPDYSNHNEILDIEITTKCHGPNNKLCSFCYKSNNPKGHNMTFETFKGIIDQMPWLTQIALGADAHGTTNPDMFKMMQYSRELGIIPNLTIADVSDEVAGKLAAVAGAVAVSVYSHAGFDVAYDSVQKLSDAGMSQINLHFMISKKTLGDAYQVTQDMKTDPRLANVNAIVFLSLKQKGRGRKHEYVNTEEYKALVDHCLDEGIPFGFDSCSAPTFLESVKDHPNFDKFNEMAEPCESTLFSSYINELGHFYPCSFTEKWKEGGWETGLDVTKSTDFIKEIWNHPKTVDFRETLINNKDSLGCRQCPAYTICGRQSIPEKYQNDIEVVSVT
jgi:radical SAM protein with 4Fe4S-binding SPASM domain